MFKLGLIFIARIGLLKMRFKKSVNLIEFSLIQKHHNK